MKKVSLFALVAAVIMAFSSVSMATEHKSGGFVGPDTRPMTTVEQAKNMKDDAKVILNGYIESSLGDEHYMFKDATGSIKVEIDDEDWRGLTVGPKDMVEIKGEVDTHWNKPTSIDVESISLIKK